MLKQHKLITICAIVLFLIATGATAQTIFDSGSTGVDGALTLTTPGTVIFDPVALGIDADGDGIYHFTTITIGAGVTVRLDGGILGSAPVIWLASGDVEIDGILDLNGATGYAAGQLVQAAIPGAGGYRGGLGVTTTHGATNGSGPGGAIVGSTVNVFNGGAGGGHLTKGLYNTNNGAAQGGPAYGNSFLMPLLGGSGGSGGGFADPNAALGAGGGAGGGAILIAASGVLTINGSIQANGGNGGTDPNGTKGGGGGSGGAIRLMATTLNGNGSLQVNGGTKGDSTDTSYAGSAGRVRLEAFTNTFAGTSDPGTATSSPGLVFPPPTAPRVRVTRVDGVDLPANPLGGVAPADITIDAAGSVTIEIQANYIPLGTVVKLTFVSEGNQSVTVNSTPLAGTLELSTATATATIPHGFAIFNVQAAWTP